MLSLKRDARTNGKGEPAPGTWWPIRWPDHDGERMTAHVCCPRCGRYTHLHPDYHAIDRDGNVTPSVICPFDSCDFHDFVRLDGWLSEVPDA